MEKKIEVREIREPDWIELYRNTHDTDEFVRIARDEYGIEDEESRNLWHEINSKYTQ